MQAGNDKKKWGRRLGCTICWAIFLIVAYYVCLFKGLDIAWFSEYAKYATLGLGFLIGGLTITDSVLKK